MAAQHIDIHEKFTESTRGSNGWGRVLFLDNASSVKSIQDRNATLGTLATFLGGVQAQTITYIVQTDSSTLQMVANAINFAGLLLDILGVCIALMAVTQLQSLSDILSRRSSVVSTIINSMEGTKDIANNHALLSRIQAHEEILFLALGDLRSWDAMMEGLHRNSMSIARALEDEGIGNDILRGRYERTSDELLELRGGFRRWGTSLGYGASALVPSVIFSGASCFIAATLCYVKDAHPLPVWATSFAVTLGTIILLLIVVIRGLH